MTLYAGTERHDHLADRYCHELRAEQFGVTQSVCFTCDRCGGDTRLPTQRGSLISREHLKPSDARRSA
jgi:hypothetical protein